MKRMTRRSFLRTSALAASSLAIIPRHVLGGKGYTPPSDKLNIAGISAGGMGGWDIRGMESENIVALCDVDLQSAAKTFSLFPKAKKYRDFRRMLDEEREIDAVVVGTPDHTHAVAAMAALKRGKHLYCEKPLAHSIHEVRLLTEEARRTDVATQMGIQGHAGEPIRLLCEWIWDGAIGDIREVHAWTTSPFWPQGVDRPTETPEIPDTLDWDLWLGPAAFADHPPLHRTPGGMDQGLQGGDADRCRFQLLRSSH